MVVVRYRAMSWVSNNHKCFSGGIILFPPLPSLASELPINFLETLTPADKVFPSIDRTGKLECAGHTGIFFFFP